MKTSLLLKSGALPAAAFLLLCACVSGGGSAVERKRGVFAPARAAAYERAVAERERIQADKQNLARFVDRRQERLDELNEKLRIGYGISLARSYTYNPTNQTIFLVYPTEDGERLLAHRAFPTQGEADEFLNVLAAKKAVANQLSVLREVYRETEQEESRLAERMRAEFGVQQGLTYRFDPRERTLYEIVPSEPKRPAKPVAPPKTPPSN